jgi:hypothetical protein
MRGSFETRSRHNERENETYGETFDRLLAEKKISEKWLKPDSKLVDELVFDVNTDYFERNGGYEFAKKFYEEAYRLAAKEVGSEDYIISAVLHADERNKVLSDQLGYDVYHYHLHVVYVPVVEKREYFRKKKGEPENAERKLKEVYQQISHAKKWPMRVNVERDGKTVVLNSYSLLQDRYFEYMKAAGFDGFERGERGSKKEHLDVLGYKIQQDEKRLEALDRRREKKEIQLEKLETKIAVKEKAKATIAEVNAMGKPGLLGGVVLSDEEAKRLKSLARKSVGIDTRAADYRKKIDTLNGEIRGLQGQINDLNRSVRTIAADRDSWKENYNRLWAEVEPYIEAIRKFP